MQLSTRSFGDGGFGMKPPPNPAAVATRTPGSSETGRRINGMTSTYSSRALDRLREHREAIGDVLAKYGATKLSRLSGIRLELEELLNIPVDVSCEELLKHRVSESARRQAIAL